MAEGGGSGEDARFAWNPGTFVFVFLGLMMKVLRTLALTLLSLFCLLRMLVFLIRLLDEMLILI